ncbi:MAG: hypothetical protein KF784_06950 [Fimbriimonadaceae bacterium]|nr:hypothetical protein [Fimbriimonadaceae bacterium]
MTNLPYLHLLEPAIAKDYESLRAGQGWYRDTSKALVELRGEDIHDWLQGQVTSDVRKLAVDAPLQACMCSPTGQLLADVTLYEDKDRILIETDRVSVAAVMKRIETMVIMEDVEGKDLSAGFDLFVLGITHEVLPSGAIVTMTAGPRNVWVPSGSQWVPTGLEIGPEAIEMARLEDGLPRFEKDMTEKTLPPEMGARYEASHISYTKGCYTGQEILMRMHSRGHTNKTWVRFTSEGLIEEGVTIESPQGEKIGTVTSSVVSPRFGYLGAGMVRNQWTAANTEVRVGGNSCIVIDDSAF